MKRHELEHIIRAAGAIAQVTELVIIGSQAILGKYPEAPDDLLVSMEADTYPPADPEKSDLIDGSIGELSPFHEQYGYYAHGIGPETACMPKNWRLRAIEIRNQNTNMIKGICPSPADIAISKLAAGREKDIVYVASMLKNALVQIKAIEELFSEMSASMKTTLTGNLKASLSKSKE